MVVALLFGMALALMAVAVLALAQSRQAEQIAKVHRRLSDIAMLRDGSAAMAANTGQIGPLSRWFARVGITHKPALVIGLLLASAGAGAFIWLRWGQVAAGVFGLVVTLAAILIPQVRYHQRMNTMVAQIPLFIDQIVRGLATGRNVEGALKLASEDLKPPLHDVMDRAQRSVSLGADLGDALSDAAQFHGVRELHLLALAIQSSRLFGGSPREMLESVVTLIRQREQMQRELRAMTGETRMSAWVLGLLPSGVAAYMVFMNPGYLETMWHDPSGQRILLIALGMQLAGGLVLWRMVKSI